METVFIPRQYLQYSTNANTDCWEYHFEITQPINIDESFKKLQQALVMRDRIILQYPDHSQSGIYHVECLVIEFTCSIHDDLGPVIQVSLISEYEPSFQKDKNIISNLDDLYKI